MQHPLSGLGQRGIFSDRCKLLFGLLRFPTATGAPFSSWAVELLWHIYKKKSPQQNLMWLRFLEGYPFFNVNVTNRIIKPDCHIFVD